MNVALQTGARPPYIEFYEDQVEDREASLAAGHYVGKPVNMVRVRQAGSKDSVERVAEDWLRNLSKNPAILPQWEIHFQAMFDQYKRGLEPAVNGTHVRDWTSASPAERKTLQAAGVLTVEDLAVANEPMLQRVGMDARKLQQKAVAWLDASKTTGKTAAELDALRVMVAQLQEKDQARDAELAALRMQVGKEGAKAVSEDDDFLGTEKKKR